MSHHRRYPHRLAPRLKNHGRLSVDALALFANCINNMTPAFESAARAMKEFSEALGKLPSEYLAAVLQDEEFMVANHPDAAARAG